MRKLVLAALSSVLALGGCAGIVGPNIQHDDQHLSAQNSPANTSRVKEGETSWTDTAEGPITTTKMPGGALMRNSGIPTNTATATLPDGTQVAIGFAQSVTGKGLNVGGPTGITVSEFGTDAADPLRAYAVISAQRQAILASLSADQRAVYEKATQAYVDSIKELGPLVLQGVKAALGVP